MLYIHFIQTQLEVNCTFYQTLGLVISILIIMRQLSTSYTNAINFLNTTTIHKPI